MALSDQPNNPMNFTENQHGNVILDKLKLQKDQGRFCDVTLYVKDRQFRAHRNVLASCSPYFDSVFKTHRVVKERLTITCQDAETFQCLLNYMYTGSIVIDKSNVGELLRLANHFLVHKLKGYCAEYMDRYLDLTNCLSVREMAEKYNMPTLSKAATIFIQIHLSKVVHQEEILSFQFPRLEAFLQNKCWSVPAAVCLSLAARWVTRDVARRSCRLRRLLSLVDWTAVDGATASDHLDREPLYAASDACLYAALQTLAENNMLFPKYQPVYQGLHDKFTQLGFNPADGADPSEDLRPDVTSQQEKEEGRAEEKAGKTCRRVFRGASRRRRKLALMRPAARLAALRAALGRAHKTQPGTADDAGLLRCPSCDHIAADACHLEHHVSSAHGRDVTYRCGTCGYTCRTQREHLAHMRAHFPGPPFNCDTCEWRGDSLQLLLTHRAGHVTADKPLACTECSYQCRGRAALAAHAAANHAPSGQHKCAACGLIFPTRPALDAHATSAHAGDRGAAHSCDACAFTTRHASHMAAHRRLHSGEVYRCSHQQCKFSAARKSQMAAHARTHAAARPHHCATCGRGFLEKSHLVRHERIHLDEKPFKCVECEYASSRRDKLKEHFVRHHGEHASAKVAYKARHKAPKNGSPAHFPAPPPGGVETLPGGGGYAGFAPEAPPDYQHQLRGKTVATETAAVAYNPRPPGNIAAAMMLDPRFHHPNGNAAYHASMPPGQHQDYPCMPLF